MWWDQEITCHVVVQVQLFVNINDYLWQTEEKNKIKHLVLFLPKYLQTIISKIKKYSSGTTLRSCVHNSYINVRNAITHMHFFREHPARAQRLSGSSNPQTENKYHVGQDLVRDHRSPLRSCALYGGKTKCLHSSDLAFRSQMLEVFLLTCDYLWALMKT